MRAGRTSGALCPTKLARRAHEHARIFRRVLAVLVLGVAVGSGRSRDADDLFRRGDWRQPGDGFKRMIGRMFLRLPPPAWAARPASIASRERRVIEPRGEIDDAAIGRRAVLDDTVDGVGGKAGMTS